MPQYTALFIVYILFINRFIVCRQRMSHDHFFAPTDVNHLAMDIIDFIGMDSIDDLTTSIINANPDAMLRLADKHMFNMVPIKGDTLKGDKKLARDLYYKGKQ